MRLIEVFACAVLCLAAAPNSVRGATFSVTKTADSADGACNVDCSLREAVIAANAAAGADTIAIPAGTYLLTRSGNDDASLLGDLDVTAALTIVGAGAATTRIDGQDLDRVLHVLPGSTAALSGLTLANGSNAFGGGVFNQGSLTLTGCVMADHVANNGGGILNAGPGAQLVLDTTTLDGNRANTTGSTANGFGGALFNESGATAMLTDATVTSNQASRDGGALYVGPGTTVSLTGGTMSSNESLNSGGAITSSGTLTVSGTAFVANTANDGGAIASFPGATAQISNASFTGNQATGLDLGGGGAFSLFQSSASVTNTTFSGNTAFGEGGGAIECYGSLTMTGGSLTANAAVKHAESQLPPDTASGFGGGLLVIAGSTVSLTGVTLSGNTAGRSGGAVYLDRNATLNTSSASFLSNEAELQFGGGIFSEGTLGLLAGTLVSTNTALSNGGGVALAFGTARITDAAIADNLSQAGGGGLYVAPGIRATLARVSLSGNDAATFGGAILNEGVVSLRDGTVNANTAGAAAGIFSQAGSLTALTRTLVSGNIAAVGGNGGGIWNEGSFSMAEGTLEGNTGGFGGGLGNRGGTASFRHVALRDNTARSQGGAIYNFDGGTVMVIRSSVTGNVSEGDFGGGVASESTVVLDRSTVADNGATLAGGGLLVNGAAANATLRGVTFSGNTGGEAIRAFGGSASFGNALIVGACRRDGGAFTSLGGNLESPANGCGFSQPSDRTGVADPLLAALSPQVDGTASRRPQSGSPAIDAGLDASCGGFDQHGARRPLDGDENGAALCEVGAIEVPEPAAAPALALAALLGLARARWRA